MHQRQLPLVKLFSIQKKLIGLGGKLVGARTVEADLAGDCSNPKGVELVAHESHRIRLKYRSGMTDSRYWTPAVNSYLRVIMHVKCRKCPECLRRRARHWRARAFQEFEGATRTWMGTLTIPSEVHLQKDYELSAALAKQGIDFEALPGPERFMLTVSGYRRNQLDKHKTVLGFGDDVTKWLKRVRKNSGAPMRYICVVEAHSGNGPNSGRPHFHFLIHENGPPIRKRTLDEAWPHFTNFKLCDEKGPLYVCKYLTKDLTDARVRASAQYGYKQDEKNDIFSASKKATF